MKGRTRFAFLVIALFALSPVVAEPTYPQVHVYQSGERGIFANAYLVETEHSIVAIDSTLSNSDSKALRATVDSLHKPLVAVLLTHGHPDHYNGLTNLIAGAQIPIIATDAVAKVIRRDDAAKQALWQPVFKDEWPSHRTFPNTVAVDGRGVQFDGVTYTVHDLGVGESDADSIWVVTAPSLKVAFIGDVVLQGVHAYLSDGHSGSWLANIERVRNLVEGSNRLYPGHGESGGLELLDQQRDYLTAYRNAAAAVAGGSASLNETQKNQLETRMLDYRKTDRLQFLIKLGADRVASELATSTRTK